MTAPKPLPDALLADYKKPEDLVGEESLPKQLTRSWSNEPLLSSLPMVHSLCPPAHDHALVSKILSKKLVLSAPSFQGVSSIVIASILNIVPDICIPFGTGTMNRPKA